MKQIDDKINTGKEMFPENKKGRGKSLSAELNNKLKFRKEGQKIIHTTINSGEVETKNNPTKVSGRRIK